MGNPEGFALQVLRALDKYEQHDDLWWKQGADGVMRFYINCNDMFCWAYSDAVEITPDNIAVLEQAYADAQAAKKYGECYGGMLFAARVYGMRPQHAAYPKQRPNEDPDQWKALVALFDAAGPERPVELGNPYPHPLTVKEGTP